MDVNKVNSPKGTEAAGRDSGRLFLLAHHALLSAGIDTAAVYRRCGFTPDDIAGADSRIPHDRQAVFWEAVEAVAGDPDVGVRIAPHLPPYGGDILSYLFLSSRTFGDGLRRAIVYQRLISDIWQMQIERTGDAAVVALTATTLTLPAQRHTETCVVHGLLDLFQRVTDGAFRARHLSLCQPPPQDSASYRDLFGCPLDFGAPRARVAFPAELLHQASAHHAPELCDLHERLAREALKELEYRDIVHRVRTEVARRLETGPPRLAEVAQALGRDRRELRQTLEKAGTGYRDIVDGCRRRLACRLLAETDVPIGRVVHRAGFSEPSPFYRAFRRWTGTSPLRWRRQQRPAAWR